MQLPARDLHSARGLRLLFSSRGVGKRLDLCSCVIQIFVALALLTVAKLLADTIMQYAFAERRHFRDYKAETTPDFSDIRAKVEEFEKQAKAEQELRVDDEDEKMV
uniref:Uncharacterized protein n=1 Tax=Calcidiscus leptoporus TaxID=127549 RepID=A0A7S0IIW5_9EUKA|mmetsp:Transcript_11063/g.25615  ORF Transcript_11063/g.25615 Transcript_11063/m.25615 type:complete len:106 (+) Transcript_11063:32-349(+)